MQAERRTGKLDTTALHLPLPRLVESSFHGLCALTDEGLFGACATRIAFTSRHGGASSAPYGSLNLGGHVGDDPALVEENRSVLLQAFGCSPLADKLVAPSQVHGTEVVVVDDPRRAAQRAREGADAVVCSKPRVPVLMCFADCVPVVMVAPGGAFAVVHAGWRGALAGIVSKGLQLLAQESRCGAFECNVYIGPHIGPCCYEVSRELLDQFAAEYGPACDAGGMLDLGAAVTCDALSAGAVPERVASASICTSCSVADYYSYRAEGGVCGRHGAFAVKGV